MSRSDVRSPEATSVTSRIECDWYPPEKDLSDECAGVLPFSHPELSVTGAYGEGTSPASALEYLSPTRRVCLGECLRNIERGPVVRQADNFLFVRPEPLLMV